MSAAAPSFTLLHTGDLHGRLTDAAAARIRQAKETAANVLLVDAGDALHAGNLGITPWGEAVLARMGHAGYDLMVAGNRETHLWQWAVRAKTGAAAFPILCANVVGRGAVDGPASALPPEALRAQVRPEVQYYWHLRVRLANGLTVAFFGLTVPMITATMPARRLSHYLFQDPIETARALVPTLSAQADVVIALTHLGLPADRALAASVPGIHLILGGHSHDLTEEPEQVNGVSILHAGAYAGYLGRAEVSLAGGRVVVRASRIPLLGRDEGRRQRP